MKHSEVMQFKHRLTSIKDLLNLWDEEFLPEKCYLRRFNIVPEYDETRDVVTFWVEWKELKKGCETKTYGIVVRLKDSDSSTESILELWIECIVSRRRTKVHRLDRDPIEGMKAALNAIDDSLVDLC